MNPIGNIFNFFNKHSLHGFHTTLFQVCFTHIKIGQWDWSYQYPTTNDKKTIREKRKTKLIYQHGLIKWHQLKLTSLLIFTKAMSLLKVFFTKFGCMNTLMRKTTPKLFFNKTSWRMRKTRKIRIKKKEERKIPSLSISAVGVPHLDGGRGRQESIVFYRDWSWQQHYQLSLFSASTAD